MPRISVRTEIYKGFKLEGRHGISTVYDPAGNFLQETQMAFDRLKQNIDQGLETGRWGHAGYAGNTIPKGIQNTKSAPFANGCSKAVEEINNKLAIAGVRVSNISGYVLSRIGGYEIIEGTGLYGGKFFAKGKGEVKPFPSKELAEEHAINSSR